MKGQRLTLAIERPVAGGRMLARHDGRVVLVSGAIPGERVVARVENVSRKVVLAATVDVVEASPDRRLPACDPACGGSVYAHIAPARQRVLKGDVVADAFRRIGRLAIDTPVVEASPERGYRLRGRLHVHAGRAGFYLERTHQVCDARATGQFRDDTLDAVARLVTSLGTDADRIASVVVAENVAASERVLHLEPHEGESLEDLAERAREVEGASGITAVGRQRLIRLSGAGRVTDRAADLCGAGGGLAADVSWTRSAASFFQGNRYLTGRLLVRVLDHVRGGAVLDLYAGVGLFAIGCVARGATVLAVEGEASSAADLELNASRWTGALTTRQASVEAALLTLPPNVFETVVLDPPRTGASPEAIAALIELAPSRLVYVSCDPATLARDAALLAVGGYRLVSVEAFDLFPNTAHIETLVVFDRSGQRPATARLESQLSDVDSPSRS